MILFYHLFRYVYQGAIYLASFRNSKARQWVDGRKNWQSNLAAHRLPKKGHPVLWMHCASLGEFEQGRPVLEELKRQKPELSILLTFFSPSGYEIRKNYEGADYVMYLPFDSAANARQLLAMVQPQVVIFVKYEYWYFYLKELKRQQIATLLIAGIFRPSQPFFRFWGGLHRTMLSCFTHLFVQNERSKKLLSEIGFATQTTVAGDPRFDRASTTAVNWTPVAEADRFIKKGKVLVAGSTWEKDEVLLAGWLDQLSIEQKAEWQLILAPHETDAANIRRLKALFPGSITFSKINQEPEPVQANILLVDNIGYLSRLYKYGTVCYVGGGFNSSGHHNIIEAAVYGKAVITGPNYQKFNESVELKNRKGSFTITTKEELAAILHSEMIHEAGAIAGAYIKEQTGATKLICKWIQENLRFTNE